MKTQLNGVFRLMHYLMIKALVLFALSAEYISQTDSIPSWRAIIDKLKEKYDALTLLYAKKSRPITSYAQRKRELKASIAEKSAAIMSAVYTYAVKTGNSVLAGEMLITRNLLMDLNYTNFVSRVQDAITIITPLVGSLADYDITLAQVTQWQAELDELNSILPKNIHATRKALNEEIQRTLGEAMTIVYNEGDRMALSFQKKGDINYYNTYLANRKLNPFTKHTKFKVTVTNEVGEGQFNIQVVQNGTVNKAITDINGEATVYVKINEGEGAQPVYEFTIGTGPNSIQSGPIEIKRGHTVSRPYVIKQSGFIMPAPQETTENTNA